MAIHLRPVPGAKSRPLQGDPDRPRRELFVARHFTNIANCLEAQAFIPNAEAWETAIHGALDAIAERIAEEGEASAHDDVDYIVNELIRRTTAALGRRQSPGKTGAA